MKKKLITTYVPYRDTCGIMGLLDVCAMGLDMKY